MNEVLFYLLRDICANNFNIINIIEESDVT